jgi:hypothetical protein
MFTIELDLFSIRTITKVTHTEHVPKPTCIPNISIVKPVQKQVKMVGVLAVKLAMPLYIINNTYLKLSSIYRLEK